MSKKEKDIELIPDTTVPSGWKVKHDGKQGDKPSNYPKIDFAKDSGPHLVVFQLPQNSPATFNAVDPIWVQKGSTSPTQPGIDPQFPDWQIFNGGKTLVLLDRNSGSQDQFSYRIKADNYTPILDPIIDNGGGIGHMSDASYWVEAGVGLLLAAVFFFIGRAYQRNLK